MHLLSCRIRGSSMIQVLVTLAVEGPLSLLALSGWAPFRATCAALWVGLMAGIAATGNYGFFNVLTCILAAALLSDGQLGFMGRFLAPKEPALVSAVASPLWIL